MESFADLADRLLEATVVPSFTRLGPAVRRRTDRWRALGTYDLTGRVVVVTGATSGIGEAAAIAWARQGAHVTIVGRDATRTTAAAVRIADAAAAAGRVDHVVADLGDLAAVAAAADELLARHERIDVLVHNAGALEAEFGRSPQGLERTIAAQVVGPFLLTQRVQRALAAAAPSRVLWVASGGLYTEPLDVDRLDVDPVGYRGTAVYALAKRAQVTLVELFGARLAADGIVVHAMHPGWADTPGVARSLPTFRRVVGPLLRDAAGGADTLVWLGADDQALASTGGFWHDRRRRSVHRTAASRRADTAAERVRLWEWCQAQVADAVAT
jgi:NAD(P)-dependent dehydrogenase (short-subunit alcohol dehydrogenase family)